MSEPTNDVNSVLYKFYLSLLVSLPVINCPNGCFHNGDCVGSVCFCYRGWTGEDCSKFHCEDLHGCSGSGECVGPNVCLCYAGFMVGLYTDMKLSESPSQKRHFLLLVSVNHHAYHQRFKTQSEELERKRVFRLNPA